MQTWWKISLLLCSFGFFREMRPSESFIIEYLTHDQYWNITSEVANRDIYPLGTYSYLALLVVIFLITDILRYKPIIILAAVSAILQYIVFLWSTNLTVLKVSQILYGVYMASEVAYYTYMYAKVSKDKYQQVTAHARAGTLGGRFVGSVIGQILLSFELMNLWGLNAISFGAQFISLAIALLLPSVSASLYFYKTSEVEDHNEVTIEEENAAKPKFSWRQATSLLWSHFITAYSNFTIVLWSFWWALAMCGFITVQMYNQVLWQTIDRDRDNLYNGAVDATLTLFGALSAFGAGFLESEKFEKWSLLVLTICSAVEGGLVLICALTKSIWVAYLSYILFGVLTQFMITIASATVAKKLQEDSFGLIFGINTLLNLIFQTILTILVVSDSGFRLDPRDQFTVFGAYFIVLALVYGCAAVISALYFQEKPKKRSR